MLQPIYRPRQGKTQVSSFFRDYRRVAPAETRTTPVLLSPIENSRLRSAAEALRSHGVRTPALDAACTRQQWPELLALQTLVDVHHYKDTAMQLGVDTALLPAVPDGAPPAGTIGGQGAALADSGPPPQIGQLRTADAVLDAGGAEPLLFDGLVDSLRGVPLDDLDGLGDKNIDRLNKVGIRSVFDLLMWIPLRYIDRSALSHGHGLTPGMEAVTFLAQVESVRTQYGAGTPYVRYTVSAEGRTVSCMFFRAMWMAGRHKRGDWVLVHGDVGEFNGMLSMSAPLIDAADDASAPMVAVYPQSQRHQVSTWLLRRAAIDALRRIPSLDDPVPQVIRTKRQLQSRLGALRAIHVPNTAAEANAGRARIAYDELLRLQLAVGVQAAAQAAQHGIAHRPTGHLTGPWLRSLPYPLTGAQQRAIDAIQADLRQPVAMNRLLQGDVGAGKTNVLIAAALACIEGGHQAALIAPSEILARQHFEEIQEATDSLGLQCRLLVGRNLPVPKKQVLADVADGSCHLVVGTHALFEDTVQFHNLGLVLVDEQHRFGVDQRSSLAGRGSGGATPDMLQATATPIPRTAAITQFGDMKVTVLDEKPPGRSPITTRWVSAVDLDDKDAAPWAAIRSQVKTGRQAFVVCPLVTNSSGQQSEQKMAAAAEEVAEQLQVGALTGLTIAVVHGKMKPAQRTEVMRQFTQRHVDVLVATTVIEVGVSIPNATEIVVLDAGKFGLAQLHQLRGRVGRGKHPGRCWLVGDVTGDGQARMEAMCATDDGFVLAAKDLAIRGPGSLLSTAQAGKESGLLVADLVHDEALHLLAREDAQRILARDPQLLRHGSLRQEVAACLGESMHYLTKS